MAAYIALREKKATATPKDQQPPNKDDLSIHSPFEGKE